MTRWRFASWPPTPTPTTTRSTRFRKAFWDDIEAVFAHVLRIAAGIGVLKLGVVSLDGTKIKANASKHSAMSYGHAKQLEARIQAELAELKRRRTCPTFHLHGSVHMGFSVPGEHQIGNIVWFDDKAVARRQASFNGSGVDRMDGTHVERGAIITGLDKLGRLQPSPYAFYYSALNREAMEADLILVLGSGLADLHLNTFLKATRRAGPDVPILYVGYWGERRWTSTAPSISSWKIVTSRCSMN